MRILGKQINTPWGHWTHQIRHTLGVDNPDIPDTAGEARTERERQDKGVARLNALYGISPAGTFSGGFDADGNYSQNAAVAEHSKKAQDALIGQQTNAAADVGLGDLNNSMDNWLTGTRRQLGDQGLLGGSVDQQAQADAVGQYLQGRTNLEQAKKSAASTIQGSFNRRRDAIEGQIRSGANANLEGIANLSTQGADISSALDDLPGKTIGNLFQQAAGGVSQGSQMQTQQKQNDSLTEALNHGNAGTYNK